MFIAFGILLGIGGAVSLIVGYSMNNSLEAQVNSIFSSGKTNPGTTYIIIGAILLIVGIILLIAGIVNANKTSSSNPSSSNPSSSSPSYSSSSTENTPKTAQNNFSVFCPNCGASIKPGVNFCPKCGRRRN